MAQKRSFLSSTHSLQSVCAFPSFRVELKRTKIPFNASNTNQSCMCTRFIFAFIFHCLLLLTMVKPPKTFSSEEQRALMASVLLMLSSNQKVVIQLGEVAELRREERRELPTTTTPPLLLLLLTPMMLVAMMIHVLVRRRHGNRRNNVKSTIVRDMKKVVDQWALFIVASPLSDTPRRTRTSG